jgi:hypothetical protein
MSSESRYSGEPSGSFVARRPSRRKFAAVRLLAMSTHAPLKAALFALISAMAAAAAARFCSTISFATGWPPVARPGIENGSASRTTADLRCWRSRSKS